MASTRNLMAPSWFHQSGHSMQLGGFQIRNPMGRDTVLLCSKESQLQILPIGQAFHVFWETRGRCRHLQGELIMDSEQIQLAFGLCSSLSQNGNGKYDRKKMGLFIGEGPHLNIPCAGTGEDGDPNISIFLTEEIKNAVKRLVTCQR